MRKFFIKDTMFGGGINLFINCTFDEFHKTLEKQIGNKFNLDKTIGSCGCCIRLTNEDDCYDVIWLKTFDWSITTQITLIHELTHYSHRINQHLGIPFSFECTEVYAYHLGFLIEESYKKLKKLYKRRKNARNFS